ncbi:MAG: prepilin peptidase [Lachnospiraceae bacterium]|nr:prepilin peptidase [Lachnospiraceae bacterium]
MMAALAFLYGLVIGSFLNVVIVRVPKGEDIIKTRSHCVHCKAVLEWYDLIPLVSFLLLKGRCRACGEKISVRYPAVELLNAAVYALIVWKTGMHVQSAVSMVYASLLIAASFIDGATRRIPNAITLCVFLVGILHVLLRFTLVFDALLGAVVVSLPLFVLWLLSNGALIGLGDVKLFVGAGLVLGWQKTLLAFVLACILGSVIHIIRMAAFQAGRQLALGPYLSAGMLIALLAGKEILHALYGI